jgi:hypothetical protein
MHSVSATMVKPMDGHVLQGYAFRLTVATVMLSWAGWQALLISGLDRQQGNTGHALLFFEIGLVFLFYSLFALLRLKRKEATPARESAQLFFGLLLIGLPLMTWIIWRHLSQVLAGYHLTHTGNAAGSAPLFACPVISIAYLLVILIWLQTSVSSYSDARPGSWPQRIMLWLDVTVRKPYFR